MSRATEPYALIRAWGLNMGSYPHYIDDQQARAKRAGAPQTAIYWRPGDRPDASRDDGRPRWVDPATGDVWVLWDEQMPAATVDHMNATASRMGTTLAAILAAAGYEKPATP